MSDLLSRDAQNAGTVQKVYEKAEVEKQSE